MAPLRDFLLKMAGTPLGAVSSTLDSPGLGLDLGNAYGNNQSSPYLGHDAIQEFALLVGQFENTRLPPCEDDPH
jgi:hypothetical protein